MQQLVQEGAIQLYRTWHSEEYIIGAVGQLRSKFSNTAY